MTALVKFEVRLALLIQALWDAVSAKDNEKILEVQTHLIKIISD